MKIFRILIQHLSSSLTKLLCCISILSFIAGTLFCNNRNHFLKIESINQSRRLIETALLDIPVCTSADRVRQRALLATLQTWVRLVHDFHVRYWITFGTLVGYVQRRTLLPHDQDIDILIMGQDTSQLVRMALNLSLQNLSWFDSNMYKLIIHPQWYIVQWENRSYFPSQSINFKAPNARFIHQQESVHIDIWPIYDYHPEHVNNTNDRTPMITGIDLKYKWESSPKFWTFPLRPCDLSGIRVWCPAEPEEIVCATYGKEALYKSDTKCLNGSWV